MAVIGLTELNLICRDRRELRWYPFCELSMRLGYLLYPLLYQEL